MKVGDLVRSGSLRDRYGIILNMKESNRPGLTCNSGLRYECHVKWFKTGRPDLDLMGHSSSWWGAWSLKVISASR